MRYTVIFIIFAICHINLCAQTLTLSDCRNAAIEHNRTLKDKKLSLQSAHEASKEAFTKYFPTIIGAANAFESKSDLLKTSIAIPQLGSLDMSMIKKGVLGAITATQPVFAGMRIVNSNKLSKINLEVNNLDLLKTELEIREQTDALFWQLAALKENIITLDAVDKQLDEIYKEVNISVKAGLVTANDLLRVDIKRQENKSARLKVNNAIKVVKIMLANSTGTDWHTLDINSSSLGAPQDPSTIYLSSDEAITKRAEYLMAEQNVTAKKYLKRIETGKYLPSAAIGAGYLYYNITDKNLNNAIAFATISVPISDWWGGSHAIKRMKIEEQRSENDLLNIKELLQVEIEQSWSTLQEAYDNIAVQKRSVDYATENLRQNRNFYKSGTASLTDLLDAETIFSKNSDDYTIACTKYQTEVSKYLRVTGR